jgi:DNA-binding transcriptional MerR regulator
MQKLYYSISEVCSIVDEEQHILRYWEKEFDGLRPKKNRGGNRIYSEKDLNVVKVIKILLREEMLSLRGAKEQLKKILDENRIQDFMHNHSLKGKKVGKTSIAESKGEKQLSVDRELLNDVASLLKESLDYLKSI